MSDLTTEENNDGEISDVLDTPPNHQINPDVLQNISVAIKVEVGRTKMKIRDLLRLTQGSVVDWNALLANRWICWSTTPSWRRAK